VSSQDAPDRPADGRWVGWGAIGVYGASSMAGQVLLMRELVNVLYGNELSLGILLGVWLLLTAVGSALASRPLLRVRRARAALAISQVCFALLLPAAIYGVRGARGLLFPDLLPGELIGLGGILAGALGFLAPICLLSGVQFALACRVLGGTRGAAAAGLGQTYAAVAVGDIVAGGLLSSAVVMQLNPFWIAFGLAVLNLISATALFSPAPRVLLAAAGAVGLVAAGVLGVPRTLDRDSARRQWRGFNLVVYRNSLYGSIAVTRDGELYSYFQSGHLAFSSPDAYSAEMNAQIPLLAHPDPQRILMIGGGVGGGLHEALKYRPRQLDYVELDPVLLEVAQDCIAPRDLAALQAPQVSIYHGDGRLFVKKAQPESYDVVMLNVPDPFTVQLNRFYTLEFFREVRRILAPRGLLSLRLTSSGSYLDTRSAELDGVVFQALRRVFRFVLPLPGESVFMLATDEAAFLARNREQFVRRLAERHLQNEYVDEYYLGTTERLDPQRMQELLDTLAAARPDRINTDLRPVACFYQMSLWNFMLRGKENGQHLADSLRRVMDLGPWPLIVTLVVLGSALSLWARRGSRSLRLLTLWALAAAGFGGLVLEVGLVFAFQALYGYVYQKVGLIVAAFMVGTIAGSLGMTRRLRSVQHEEALLARTGVFGVACAVLAALCLPMMARLTGAAGDLAAQALIPILVCLGGVVVGMQFPLGGSLLLRGGRPPARAGGQAYAADLLGASAGALVTTVLLLPAVGIVGTCLAAAGVFCTGALPLLVLKK